MSQYEKPLLAILSGTKGKNLLFSDLRLMLERVDFQCRSQETACVKYEIILYWSEDNHTYIIEVLEQRVVRNAREEIRVQALTHKLTQNRNKAL